MTIAGVGYIVLGVICLSVSGVLMYKMIPREGRPASGPMGTETRETAMALSQFILLVAGLAFFAKAIL